MGKTAFTVALALIVSPGITSAQSPHPSVLSSTASAKADWDTSPAGKWTYRSYANRADVLVNADPGPAVQALAPVFGSGAATAASSLKALNLVFGEGVMTFDTPTGNALTGNLDMGGGYVLDLKGTTQTSASGDIAIDLVGTGRPGTMTDNWEYDYKATTTPRWPNGVGQVPALVGTVIRAKPHDGQPAGVVVSFIAIKQ
jgi:hypothetical protein